MIYELKQKLRHSATGNRILQRLESSVLFPPLYNTLFRFGLDEFSRNVPTEVSQQYFAQNEEKIQYILRHLADETSKTIYTEILQCRKHHKLPRYRSPKDQYFPSSIIQLSDAEVFVDCGAFTGDTIAAFLQATQNKYKKIVAFESDPHNFAALKAQSITHCECFNIGVWHTRGKLSFTLNGTGSALEQASPNHTNPLPQITVPVEAIDQCPACRDMTYLKMDIEGAELPALKGAEQTIRKQRPKLGICIYHSNRDLIEIPLWILSLQLNYKLYVRHHGQYGLAETVLYAV